MRRLSNGFGFFMNTKQKKAVFVKPKFVADFESSDLNSPEVLKLIKGGKGYVIDQANLDDLNQTTKVISLLGPATSVGGVKGG